MSDDQGFRIVINGFPNLTDIGGMGSVGTGRPHDGPRRLLDPGRLQRRGRPRGGALHDGRARGGFSPGHNNAIIMSEYNDTANPLLDGHPQDINCSRNNPPVWNFTGDVGYSAMCPDSDNTLTILSTIIDPARRDVDRARSTTSVATRCRPRC